LTVLAGSNGILWLLAGLPRGQPSVAAGMAFTTAVFVLATLFAMIAPETYIAQWLWSCAFATPFIDGFFERRRKSETK
jgi:phosphatidylglycerophosphate synthase